MDMDMDMDYGLWIIMDRRGKRPSFGGALGRGGQAGSTKWSGRGWSVVGSGQGGETWEHDESWERQQTPGGRLFRQGADWIHYQNTPTWRRLQASLGMRRLCWPERRQEE